MTSRLISFMQQSAMKFPSLFEPNINYGVEGSTQLDPVLFQMAPVCLVFSCSKSI